MIPWKGDIVKPNPKNVLSESDPYTSLRESLVEDVILSEKECICYVKLNTYDYQFVILLSDGRAYGQPEGNPPLFVLVRGPKTIEVKRGDKFPLPEIGNEYETIDLKMPKGLHTIEQCKCYNNKEGWPFESSCGAHLSGTNRICFKNNEGWIFDGTLYRNIGQEVGQVNLKVANTRPDAMICAACGCPLKDPGMGPVYKHCPKCEP